MLTHRPYMEALSLERTIDEIKKKAGSRFDPFIVESFVNMMNTRGREILKAAGYGLVFSSVN